MSGKAPAMQFYVRDWLSDPQLRMVSFQTKGLWMDLLCLLWESPERGILVGTKENFRQMLGCSEVEFDKFVAEANVTKFADVTNGNGVVTVKNRRMFRDEKIRHDTRLRVARFREKRESNPPCNANVTTPSSSSSSLVSKDTCPQKEIVDLYHEVLPELRKVRIWSEARQKMMRQRWKHSDKTSSLEWWRDFFGYIKLSDFLMGKVKEDFQVDLEWIIRPKNFVKIVEGKYHR